MSRGCPEASVTLIPGDTDNIFLGLEQGSLEISDIRIDCKNVNIGLMAHSGELRLSNVTLMGGGTSVLVGAGARLVMSGSKVTDAGIGVEIGSGKLSLSCHLAIIKLSQLSCFRGQRQCGEQCGGQEQSRPLGG